MLAPERLAEDHHLPARLAQVGAAAARLQCPHQAVDALKVVFVLGALLGPYGGHAQHHALAGPAAPGGKQGLARGLGHIFAKVDAGQLAFERATQVFHGLVDVGAAVVGHHAKVQRHAFGAALEQVHQARVLPGVERGIDVGQRLAVGLVFFVVDLVEANQAQRRAGHAGHSGHRAKAERGRVQQARQALGLQAQLADGALRLRQAKVMIVLLHNVRSLGGTPAPAARGHGAGAVLRCQLRLTL